jgi:uncharacterized repeat protein (TIGR03803 family)
MINLIPTRRLFLSFSVLLALTVTSFSAQAQTYTVIHNFAGEPSDGALANGELIQDAAGNFYGTTQEGGAYNYGTVFKLDPSGVVTILNSFTNGSDGGLPYAGLFLDPTGTLYGTTWQGGDYGLGTVFKLDTSNVLTTLHSFKGGTDGASPQSRLVSIDGVLYGTTSFGGSSKCDGSGCGTIFKITKSGRIAILARFDAGGNGGAEGSYPWGLLRDPAGNLYGVALYGGTTGRGTVFKLDTAGVFTVLYDFTGADGAFPEGRLIRNDSDGSLRGTTVSGGSGACSCGVVFRLDTNGQEAVLHSFFDYGGGSEPYVGLLDVGGTLYGTTDIGGDSSCFPEDHGCGVLYQIGKTGQYTVLHRFAGAVGADGAYPRALTLGTDGSVYGATVSGGTGTACRLGASGCGVIFKFTP